MPTSQVSNMTPWAGRETAWGIEQAVQIEAPLNTSGVLNQIFPIQSGGPSISNNGVLRDGGVTEVYEYGYTLNGPDQVYICKNGAVVGLDGSGNIHVGSATSVKIVGQTSDVTFSRLSAPGYLDVIPSSYAPQAGAIAGTLIALRFATPTEAAFGGLSIDELNADDLSVLDTVVVSTTQYVGAVLARANNVLFSKYMTADDTGVLAWNSANELKWIKNSTVYAVATGISVRNQFQAYFSPVAASLGVGVVATGTGIVYSNTSLAGWAAATFAVAYTSTLGTITAVGLTMAPIQNLLAATTTLKLGVATNTRFVPNFVINVSAAGAVTTTSAWTAGLYAGAGAVTETLFQMIPPWAATTSVAGGPNGTVTPLGSTGLYGKADISKTNASNSPSLTPWGTFGFGYSSPTWSAKATANSTAATVMCKQAPDANLLVGTLLNACVVVARTFLNTVSLLAAGKSASAPPSMVNDFGGGSYQSDIPSGCGVGNTSNSGMFIPPTLNGDSLSCTYKTNAGIPVVVKFSEVGAPVYIFNEIAPGVVSLNTVGGVNSIIDANTGALYDNCGAYVNSFHMDRVAATDVCNFKTFNLYSSQIDPGLMYATAAVPPTAGLPANIIYYDDSLANQRAGVAAYGCTVVGASFTGAYLGDVNLTSLYQNAAHAGIYVYQVSVPVAADATFTGAGIIMLFASAVQTQNYFGYVLYSGSISNLLQVKMEAMWLLHGSLYAFDGDAIYSISLSGGSVGTVQGAPVKAAFATGLDYLCVSPTRAFFKSPWDNSLFSFDGGRTVTKIGFFSAKQKIYDAVYSPVESSLVMRMSNNGITGTLITMRDDEQNQEMFSTVPKVAGTTETAFPGNITNPPLFPSISLYPLPTLYPSPSWTLETFAMFATVDGVYYVNQNKIVKRSYYPNSGDILPMTYESAFLGLGEGQTMQVGRIVIQLSYLSWNGFSYIPGVGTPLGLSWFSVLSDGTRESDFTTITPTTNNDGYAWISWTPPHSNVLAGSIALTTGDIDQKIVLLQILMYYMAGPEMIPVPENQVAV